MNGQMSIFDITMPMISIENKIRLIELFAGYGSQAMALEVIGADYEHYKVVEFDKYAVQSYNAVHGTNFEPTDIRDIHGKDLEIIETERYTYLLTYSFPCTDLSVAGKMQGMKKGSGTRSCLLWEVERILQELKDGQGELPQVLFMENVPQVISAANINDFHLWQDFLTSLGYTSHVDTLNAKDYGVAQNRERAFMFSFLGEFNYKFPQPIPLTKTMKDYLEDEVDEKYYINSDKADKLIGQLIDSGDLQGCVGNVNPSGNGLNGNVYAGDIAPTLTTNKGEGQKICVDLSIKNPSENNIANCITSRENRGISNQQSVGNGVIVKQIGNIAEENNFSNPQTGRVYATDGCSPTLNTCSGGGHEPKICVEPKCLNSKGGRNKIEKLQPSVQDRVYDTNYISTSITSSFMPSILENKTIVAMRGRNPDNSSDRTVGSPTEQRLEPNSQGLCNTITSVQKDNMVLEAQVLTPKRTEYGKSIRKAYESGEVKESRHNMTQLEPRNDGISNTLTTVQKDNMVLERCVDLYNQKQRSDELCGTLTTNSGTQFHCGSMGIVEKVRIKQATKYEYIECKIGGVADLSYPNSETRRGRVQENGEISPTITATETGICGIESLYRIRKLTPRECGRLMAVSDENISKILSVVSNSQAYKQFGNSIVVLCMIAMFSNLNIQGLPRWEEIKERGKNKNAKFKTI